VLGSESGNRGYKGRADGVGSVAALDPVREHEGAAHDQLAVLEITNPNAEKFAFRVQEAYARTATTINGVTIGALMQWHGARRILIVKVDIEGAELALFRSNISWLDRTELLIVETHDWLFRGQGTSRTSREAHPRPNEVGTDPGAKIEDRPLVTLPGALLSLYNAT